MRIDFHSHILPGADHGSSSVETSLKQIELLSSVGIEKIVATPHFYPQTHNVDSFLSARRECADELSANLDPQFPEIYLGAEVLVCAGLEKMEGLSKLCIDGTNTLLLEMPLTSKWSESLYETVYNISLTEVNVVLAHVDRYPIENIRRLMSESDVKGQINVSACGSFFRNRRFVQYLETGKIVAVGSDIHKSDKSCAEDFAYFLKWKNGKFEQIFSETEKYLVGAKSIK